MHRLQISLTSDQYEFLKSEAFVVEKSMAAVLRDLLDSAIQARQQELLASDPIWDVIGVGEEADAPTDISENVDRYLYGQPVEADHYYPVPTITETADEYAAD